MRKSAIFDFENGLNGLFDVFWFKIDEKLKRHQKKKKEQKWE